MTNYRRIYILGSTWFFTANLAERRGNYLLVEKIDLLRVAFRYVKERKPYRINAVVIMPDPVAPGKSMEGGHIDSWSNGGATDETNGASSCRDCNRAKSDKHLGTRDRQYTPSNPNSPMKDLMGQ